MSAEAASCDGDTVLDADTDSESPVTALPGDGGKDDVTKQEDVHSTVLLPALEAAGAAVGSIASDEMTGAVCEGTRLGRVDPLIEPPDKCDGNDETDGVALTAGDAETETVAMTDGARDDANVASFRAALRWTGTETTTCLLFTKEFVRGSGNNGFDKAGCSGTLSIPRAVTGSSAVTPVISSKYSPMPAPNISEAGGDLVQR
jgi:hypothetical protein